MIETITVITLSILYLVFFRPGKTPELESPLLIDRPGRYRITLAAKLNLAQPFIESVASGISFSTEALHGNTTQFFAVRDKQAGPEGFLLVIGYRDGMLYFQAEQPPRSDEERPDWLAMFTDDVLAGAPARDRHSAALDAQIISAVQRVATEQGVDVMLLHAGGTVIRRQPLTSQHKPFEFCR